MEDAEPSAYSPPLRRRSAVARNGQRAKRQVGMRQMRVRLLGVARAQKYLPKGSSAVLGFGVKGGREAGAKFINNLKFS